MTEEIEYPSTDELRFWWRCWRKVGYTSRESAERVTAAHGEGQSQEAYLCAYSNHWHNGHRKSEESAYRSVHLRPTRLRKQWRRQTNHRPTINALRECFSAGIPWRLAAERAEK